MKIATEGPRERFMLMGAPGSGKSNAVISVAKHVDTNMFILDTELDVYERLLWGEEGITATVEPTGCMPDDWDVMSEWAKEVRGKVSRDDWVVVDSSTPTWGAVQNWFSERIMGDHLADMMLKAREDLKGGNVNPFEGWTDWSVINAQYARFVNNILRCNALGAHVIFTAELDVIGDDDAPATRALYGKWGAKPRGQKRLPHVPHDTLFMRQTRQGYEMNTVKAQGTRPDFDGPIADFAKQYLMGTAGWKVVT